MSTKPSILVVEDKALLAEDLVDRLESFGYDSIIGPFDNAEEALERAKKEKPGIALLDINLKGNKDGIELARELQQSNGIPIIYLTQLEDDRVLQQTVETKPVAYLSKPFTNAALKHALLMAENATINDANNQEHDVNELVTLDDRIFIRNGRGKVQIKIDDILWIQSGGGETSAITILQRHKDKKLPFTVGLNLNKLEDRLSFSQSLIRCSRFYIVNIKHVDRILDDSSKVKNKKLVSILGNEIPVGDKYKKNVMDKLHLI